MNRIVLLAGCFTASLLSGACAAGSQKAPQVDVVNGTFAGVYLPTYEQEAFLGMHYAQDTSGQQRFRRPKYIDEKWSGVRDAIKYTPAVSLFIPVPWRRF